MNVEDRRRRCGADIIKGVLFVVFGESEVFDCGLEVLLLFGMRKYELMFEKFSILAIRVIELFIRRNESSIKTLETSNELIFRIN